MVLFFAGLKAYYAPGRRPGRMDGNRRWRFLLVPSEFRGLPKLSSQARRLRH